MTDWARAGLSWPKEIDAHNAAKSGVHGFPSFGNTDLGSGLVWNGTAWEKASLMTPAKLAETRFPPAGAVRQSMTRNEATSSTVAAPESGRLNIFAIYLYKGDVVSNLVFVSGGTKEQTGTHLWAALFNSSLEKLAISADDTGAEAWAANAAKIFAMTSPYTVLADGWFYGGICCAAGTPPTFSGSTSVSGVSGLTPKTAALCDTGLTTPASCPSKATIGASRNGCAYFYVT